MKTLNTVRPVWGGMYVLFAILLFSFVIPYESQALAPCEYSIEPIWQEAEGLRSELEADPFASAFKQYIDDLRNNATELEQWRAYVGKSNRNECIPHMNDVARFENRKEAYISRGCDGEIEDEGLYAWCQSEYAELTSWEKTINDRDIQEKRAEDKINGWGQELLSKEQRAVEHGREMLKPGNLENAFRLYAFSVKKNVDAGHLTSCEALAQMAEALAEKSGGQYGMHLAIMGSVLAPTGNPLVLAPHARSVEFTGSGFRRRFIGPPGRERDNQVRHAVAYLMAGAEFGATGATMGTYMEDKLRQWWGGRVPENHDYLLGVAAGEIGRDLRSHLSINDLGNTIRDKLCGY